MKTTSYEISKKLKKAGFVAETEYYWHAINNKIELYHVARAGLGDVKAYDLETMLDALPSVIERKGWGNDIYFKMNKNGFWYENSCSCDSSEYCPLETYYHIDRQKNESLADIAGKMWLLLKEKGMV